MEPKSFFYFYRRFCDQEPAVRNELVNKWCVLLDKEVPKLSTEIDGVRWFMDLDLAEKDYFLVFVHSEITSRTHKAQALEAREELEKIRRINNLEFDIPSER